MTISNYCDCANDIKYVTNIHILHKLEEVKQSLLFEMDEKISSLESKVNRLLNEMQGCSRYNDTRGKLLLQGKEKYCK